MTGQGDSLRRLQDPRSSQRLSGEVVPCPKCGLLAPVLTPPPSSTCPEARCASGHFTVLVPAVHDRLRSLLGPAFS
jgi:hypothetical protein